MAVVSASTEILRKSQVTAMAAIRLDAPGNLQAQLRLFPSFDPTDNLMRQNVILEHPLMMQTGYAFPTPSVKNALNQLVEGISAGLPGMAWVAYSRCGKSTAIRVIVRQLADTYPDTPVFSFVAKHHKEPNEMRFYKELIAGCGFSPPPGRKADEHFERLWKSLYTSASNGRSSRVILLIDEAQKLSTDEYSWLIDLTNSLAAQGISVTVGLFGQPELIQVRNTFYQTGRVDIIGRFMVVVEAFEGVRNCEELREVLACLDNEEMSEYPDGSGCSCTEFFVHEAYRLGWRFEDQAENLWRAFVQSAASRVAEEKLSIGMNWVKLTVQKILLELMEGRPSDEVLTAQFLVNAINGTGFVDSLGVLSTEAAPNAPSTGGR